MTLYTKTLSIMIAKNVCCVMQDFVKPALAVKLDGSTAGPQGLPIFWFQICKIAVVSEASSIPQTVVGNYEGPCAMQMLLHDVCEIVR